MLWARGAPSSASPKHSLGLSAETFVSVSGAASPCSPWSPPFVGEAGNDTLASVHRPFTAWAFEEPVSFSKAVSGL